MAGGWTGIRGPSWVSGWDRQSWPPLFRASLPCPGLHHAPPPCPCHPAGDDPNFRGRGNRSSGEHFAAAPNIDHTQDFVKRDLQGGCGVVVQGKAAGCTQCMQCCAMPRQRLCLGCAACPRPPPAAAFGCPRAEWLAWLRTHAGFDGWRLDYVRGFAGSHVKDYMEASCPQFAVGEHGGNGGVAGCCWYRCG